VVLSREERKKERKKEAMARFTLHRTAPASCASCASTSTRARRARTALRTRCMGERTSASRCPCGSQATSSVKTNTRAKKRSRSRVIIRSRSDRKDGLYELLGVSPKSSQKEIKTAYRRLAKANHPDVGGDPEKFKSIAKAYAVLSTPGARKEYDRQQYRASNYSSYSSYTSSVEDTFDFFAKKAKEEDFYGLGDLFRDIEQEFSGMKDESSIFKKLGEDLLDFLEGSAYAPVRVSLLTAK